MSIGKRIKFLRTQRGMTIDEVAAKLDKNRTTVYRYENGDIENLPLGILLPLSEVLGTTPADLLGWAEKETIVTEISEDNEETTYLPINKSYVRYMEMWHKEFGPEPFTDEEYEKLIEYGKFLISLRKTK